jgi:hypothetical protein
MVVLIPAESGKSPKTMRQNHGAGRQSRLNRTTVSLTWTPCQMIWRCWCWSQSQPQEGNCQSGMLGRLITSRRQRFRHERHPRPMRREPAIGGQERQPRPMLAEHSGIGGQERQPRTMMAEPMGGKERHLSQHLLKTEEAGSVETGGHWGEQLRWSPKVAAQWKSPKQLTKPRRGSKET